MEPFTKLLTPLQWCQDLEALLALKSRNDVSGKRLLEQRHPGQTFVDEYFQRIRAAAIYLLNHKAEWKRAGLMTDQEILSRAVLFSLYGHYAAGDLKTVLSVDPPTDMFVYGANRALKHFGNKDEQ